MIAALEIGLYVRDALKNFGTEQENWNKKEKMMRNLWIKFIELHWCTEELVDVVSILSMCIVVGMGIFVAVH